MQKNGISRFIFASTCSNYGIIDPNKPANETNELNPVSLYAETKIDCEKYILSLATDKFHPTSLRFGTAFGISFRTRFDLLINSFVYESLHDGEIVVFGANMWRPYIHVSEMSTIMLKILTSEEKLISKQIFNAESSENFTKEQVVNMILKNTIT